MKISTYQHEILNLSWWKFRPLVMNQISTISTIHNKISTSHHENLDLPLWKPQPFIVNRSFIMKMLNNQLFIIKSRPVTMKFLTCHREVLNCSKQNHHLSPWKSPPVLMEFWICHHENFDLSSWKLRPAIMKISTVHNKVSTSACHDISRPFIATSAPFIIDLDRLLKNLDFLTQMAFHWFRNGQEKPGMMQIIWLIFSYLIYDYGKNQIISQFSDIHRHQHHLAVQGCIFA